MSSHKATSLPELPSNVSPEYPFFSSLDPLGYCHHLASIVVCKCSHFNFFLWNPLGKLDPNLIGIFIWRFYETVMFFLLIGSTWKNQEAMKCQKMLSVFVCRAFIFQPIFYHTSVKLSLYTVVYYVNIFLYASYHFQDIRGSKWNQHSKFRIFISSPSLIVFLYDHKKCGSIM